MKLIFAMVVFGASFAVFFADEWLRLFKKCISIRGVPLLVPLMIASWIVVVYDAWGQWMFYWIRAQIECISEWVVRHTTLGFMAEHIVRILILTSAACLPVCLSWVLAKYKKRAAGLTIAYRIGLVLWMILVVVVLN